MKLYNINTDRIENDKTFTHDGINYIVNKLTTEELITFGRYKIKYLSKPNRRYYTSEETKELIDDVYTISYTQIEKALDDIKKLMHEDLFEASEKIEAETEIDTDLGYKVKGTRNDLDSFERGAKRGILEIRDTNYQKQNVNISELNNIITKIEDNGFLHFNTKGFKFDEINDFTTVQECMLYEATPYEKEIDEIDEFGELTGNKIIDTLYKNNVKEWSN